MLTLLVAGQIGMLYNMQLVNLTLHVDVCNGALGIVYGTCSFGVIRKLVLAALFLACLCATSADAAWIGAFRRSVSVEMFNTITMTLLLPIVVLAACLLEVGPLVSEPEYVRSLSAHTIQVLAAYNMTYVSQWPDTTTTHLHVPVVVQRPMFKPCERTCFMIDGMFNFMCELYVMPTTSVNELYELATRTDIGNAYVLLAASCIPWVLGMKWIVMRALRA